MLGRNVDYYRRAAKLTQEELAARIGMGQYYISGLEAGKRNPTLETMCLIADALGIRVKMLLEDSARRKTPTGKRLFRS